MKLFKKKAKDEEINETEDQAAAAGSTADNIAEEPKEKKPHDLKFALIRCAGALVVAAALLFATGFSAISLVRGPAESVSVQDEENGAFVKKEIIAILANYAPEGEKGYYAVVPMNGALVTVNFTGRYQESVDEIMSETAKFVGGTISALDKYVVVQGTVSQLSEEQSTAMYEWFAANKDAMVANNVISDAYDAADYLSEKVLLVDTVNGMNQTLVMALSALALLLVLYVIAELVLMALGFYKSEKPAEETHSDDIGELRSPIAAALDAEEAAAKAETGATGSGMMTTPIKHEAPDSEEDK